MTMMDTTHIRTLLAVGAMVTLSNCTKMDTRIDTEFTEAHIQSDYSSIMDFGYMAYTKLQHGFFALDGNLFAAATDEAEQTASTSGAQLFNNGSWNAFNNPDNPYANAYEGIRAANFFLTHSADYRAMLAHNRDTLSDNGLQYRRDVLDVSWLRAENRVLRAYFYFELLKRYGGVPLITQPLSITDNLDVPRSSVDEVVSFIVTEIDAVRDSLQTNWISYDEALDGRLTLGAALALKSRTLLYAASPLHNSEGNPAKWELAAQAAHEVIALQQYSLHPSYPALFVGDQTAKSNETIWGIRIGPDNTLERNNYPVGTPGGNSGVTPSHNLVAAYEHTAEEDPTNPYGNRDPRLGYTIAYNNSNWNGRTIETWSGGRDAHTQTNASRTGYYLKKFMTEQLNLVQGEQRLRTWIVFRYAETMLNYAEAVNEAYGPDQSIEGGPTAREALQVVRSRPGVALPPVNATSREDLREGIKHERRVELAFEDHRFWDLRRWQDAQHYLSQPLMGIRASRNTDGTFSYTEFRVEGRVFDASRMYLHPIPQSEINKSANVLIQNPGW